MCPGETVFDLESPSVMRKVSPADARYYCLSCDRGLERAERCPHCSSEWVVDLESDDHRALVEDVNTRRRERALKRSIAFALPLGIVLGLPCMFMGVGSVLAIPVLLGVTALLAKLIAKLIGEGTGRRLLGPKRWR